jgi:hypothetical protein
MLVGFEVGLGLGGGSTILWWVRWVVDWRCCV